MKIGSSAGMTVGVTAARRLAPWARALAGAPVLAMSALALVGLTAPACEVYVGSQPPPAPPRATPSSAATPPPAPPGASQPATAAPPPAAAPAPPPKTVSLHLHGSPPAQAAGGGTPPAASGAPAAPPAPPPTGACLDATPATAGDCGALAPPDPSCSAAGQAGPLARQRCAAYKAYFAPKVAAAAVACMTSLAGKELCDPARSDACARAALAQACPDSAVAQLCGVAATACKSTASDCTAMLSGLNDQGKQLVAQCVAQGCSAGLYACVQGLGTSASAGTAKR